MYILVIKDLVHECLVGQDFVDKFNADEKEPKVVINLIDLVDKEQDVKQLRITPSEQNKDQCINWVKQILLKNGEIRQEITQFETNFRKRLYDLYEKLYIENGLLFLNKECGSKVVVLPKHLLLLTIEKVHNSILGGHLGSA
ncbi:hypothetical protein BpHYR1_048528 [Brachionus plicatilis]|uniref:Uncharacterized protein n=1 Tax=Brachionus plicatilis TaxID=10195 RepID=A0A3M7Q6A2_BRAPC|nr:hypothetical protein BpHYR1_048528 [Brachionus plicatilis]